MPNACFAMEEAGQRGPHPSDYTLGPLREVEFPQSLTGARLFEPGRRASQPPSNASVVESDPVRRTWRAELRAPAPPVMLESMLRAEMPFPARTTLFCPHTVVRGGRVGLSRREPSEHDRGRRCRQTDAAVRMSHSVILEYAVVKIRVFAPRSGRCTRARRSGRKLR